MLKQGQGRENLAEAAPEPDTGAIGTRKTSNQQSVTIL
jgi:hypothetical protein